MIGLHFFLALVCSSNNCLCCLVDIEANPFQRTSAVVNLKYFFKLSARDKGSVRICIVAVIGSISTFW